MKLADFVCFDATIPELESTERNGVISELIMSLDKAGRIKAGDSKGIIKAVIKREDEASTGIGKGVAVPHVKHASVKDVEAVVGCSSRGIDFKSLDKQPVYTVILLLSPMNNPDRHLQAMENIFRNLQKEDFRKFLRQAQNAEQVKDVIVDADEEAQ